VHIADSAFARQGVPMKYNYLERTWNNLVNVQTHERSHHTNQDSTESHVDYAVSQNSNDYFALFGYLIFKLPKITRLLPKITRGRKKHVTLESISIESLHCPISAILTRIQQFQKEGQISSS
jgi:hypothetical protein